MAVGFTTVGDSQWDPDDVAVFEKLHAAKELPVRTGLTRPIDANRPIDQIEREINASKWNTGQGDGWLGLGTFKVTLDGGQSASVPRISGCRMVRSGPSALRPDLSGTPEALCSSEPDKLYQIRKQHGQRAGSGPRMRRRSRHRYIAECLRAAGADKPIRGERHHVMHGSFMSEEAVQKMKRLGVGVDAQPGWVYLDVPALQRVFGLQNMKWSFPLKSFLQEGIPVAGSSDHMIGHGKDNAGNPFNPFLNMWACVTRMTTEGKVFNAEQRISR